MEDVEEGSVLVTDRGKIIHANRGKHRLVKGTVVASGVRKCYRDFDDKERWTQEPLPIGASVYAIAQKHCLRIHRNDPDLPEVSSMIPEGFTLCLYGMAENWDTYVFAEAE